MTLLLLLARQTHTNHHPAAAAAVRQQSHHVFMKLEDHVRAVRGLLREQPIARGQWLKPSLTKC